jgi:mannose/fructose/N-acetylgalactosamine-specific phosphotransferase system component IIC
MMDLTTLAALAVWGTVVGVDLVSFPQAMLSRPIVAATVAGALAGDAQSGLRVGVLLELFALDVLPIGASRYPDYGPGAVAAAAVAVHASWSLALGIAAALGLLLAAVGGRSIELLRRSNGRLVRRHEAQLIAGDPGVIRRLHLMSLGSDVVRSFLLTILGLALAGPVATFGVSLPLLDRSLTLTLVAGGIVAAIHGLMQRARVGAPRNWLVAGLAAGAVIAWLA